MRCALLILLANFAFFRHSFAIDVQGSIAWNTHCPDIASLHPQPKIVLDGGRYSARVRKDGGFTFFNVEPGAYLLEVLARDHVFDQLRVDILDESLLSQDLGTTPAEENVPASLSVQVRPFLPGTPFSPSPPHHPLAYPILLVPLQRKEYFALPDGFDVMSMLNNPMAMMMVFACITLFILPKAMQNMDPEMLKEMSERHGRIMKIQSDLHQGDFSGIASGVMEDVNRGAAKTDERCPPPKKANPAPVSSSTSSSKKQTSKRRR
ncbi:uncharacterized protein EI90DRAFT_3291461 [Cantharellus anzutake]|uniref:uncharacterized protein n=1 Tax=Cantharellus anzutake TaxID=1750568 RepID=UPI001907BEFC|nr:uncharacterized protein EI90DRAFT_3291461 [Cantharellus anzutake]KAF8326213.1 hypothetical protein EI90DRAFT_3291461 [Cantharellus anzutake]